MDVNADLDNFINVIFIYVVNNQVFVMDIKYFNIFQFFTIFIYKGWYLNTLSMGINKYFDTNKHNQGELAMIRNRDCSWVKKAQNYQYKQINRLISIGKWCHTKKSWKANYR